MEALELFRMFPDTRGSFRLSTAVRMSASFPYFSPAVALPTSPRRRVVDAGYYDNYGVSLASAWLFSARNASLLEDYASKIVLVQIRASVSEKERTLATVPREDPSHLGRALEELTSPPEGMYNSVFAAAAFRNDGQLELLSAYFRGNQVRQAARQFEREVEGLLAEKGVDKPAMFRKLVEQALTDWLSDGPKVKDDRFGDRLKKALQGKLKKDADSEEVMGALRKLMKAHFPDPKERFHKHHYKRFFSTVTFEFGGKAALSWYFSRADLNRVNQAARPNNHGAPGAPTNIPEAISDLLKWWMK
jgi:hypothetical protein